MLRHDGSAIHACIHATSAVVLGQTISCLYHAGMTDALLTCGTLVMRRQPVDDPDTSANLLCIAACLATMLAMSATLSLDIAFTWVLS